MEFISELRTGSKSCLVCKLCICAIFVVIFSLHQTMSSPVHSVKHARSKPEASCLYDNKTYSAGTRFRPDPCTFCHCTRHGGRPRCAIEDCIYEPSCVRYVKSEQSECCRICVEKGCLDADGHVYYPGELVVRGACSTCVCPVGGGRIECTQETCPDVRCVDPERVEGDCCLRCPNGPNCWLNGRVIPAGKIYHVGRCKSCHCPVSTDSTWGFGSGPKALCSFRNCLY